MFNLRRKFFFGFCDRLERGNTDGGKGDLPAFESSSGGAGPGVSLDTAVHLIAYQAGDDFPDFGVVEEPHHLVAIALQQPITNASQLAVENAGEVVDGVRFPSVAHRFDGAGAYLCMPAARLPFAGLCGTVNS
jgi:hypothetical protein